MTIFYIPPSPVRERQMFATDRAEHITRSEAVVTSLTTYYYKQATGHSSHRLCVSRKEKMTS